MLGLFKKPQTYYDILKIRPDASDKDILLSYKTLLKDCETNKKLRKKTMKVLRIRLLTEAYAALRTEQGRNRYNRLLLLGHGKPKGIALKPDNDNKKVLSEQNLWIRISHFLKPSQSKERRNG